MGVHNFMVNQNHTHHSKFKWQKLTCVILKYNYDRIN